MKRDFASPKEYLADLDRDQLEITKRVRKAIRSAMPRFVEKLRYGMLDYPGLANLGAQKRYVALYVAPEVLSRYRERFPGVSRGKSCLRFTKAEQVDPVALEELLKEIWEFRSASDG